MPIFTNSFVLKNSDWPVYDGDLETFQNDWVEIEIEKSVCKVLAYPQFLSPTLDQLREKSELLRKMAEKFYKFVTFDTDHNCKSERKEWGHLKYQRRYLGTVAKSCHFSTVMDNCSYFFHL